MKPQPLRVQAFEQLATAREFSAGGWPRHDVEDAFARAQVLATLAVEEQVRHIRLTLIFAALYVLIVLVAILVVVS